MKKIKKSILFIIFNFGCFYISKSQILNENLYIKNDPKIALKILNLGEKSMLDIKLGDSITIIDSKLKNYKITDKYKNDKFIGVNFYIDKIQNRLFDIHFYYIGSIIYKIEGDLFFPDPIEVTELNISLINHLNKKFKLIKNKSNIKEWKTNLGHLYKIDISSLKNAIGLQISIN